MTKENLEELSLREIVNEIVAVEIKHKKLIDEMRYMDNIELGMRNDLGAGAEYVDRLKALYTELDKREEKI